jgi:hypothetical protein
LVEPLNKCLSYNLGGLQHIEKLKGFEQKSIPESLALIAEGIMGDKSDRCHTCERGSACKEAEVLLENLDKAATRKLESESPQDATSELIQSITQVRLTPDSRTRSILSDIPLDSHYK